jgi:putative transposase
VRRPGGDLARGGPAPLRSQAFNLTKAEIAQVWPKRRQAGALQRVESSRRLFVLLSVMLDLLHFDNRLIVHRPLTASTTQLFNSAMLRDPVKAPQRPAKDWLHAPVHRLDSNGIYMVTGATLRKEHLFTADDKLTLFEKNLLTLAKNYQWQLEAWAVFVNHYHFVARGSVNSRPLDEFLNSYIPTDTARKLNLIDQSAGRDVWFNFWDTKLTFERSYLARLNYVHQNAVKHGLVLVANQYQWCSAAWFERTASLSAVKTIYSFKTDKLNIHDDY